MYILHQKSFFAAAKIYINPELTLFCVKIIFPLQSFIFSKMPLFLTKSSNLTQKSTFLKIILGKK